MRAEHWLTILCALSDTQYERANITIASQFVSHASFGRFTKEESSSTLKARLFILAYIGESQKYFTILFSSTFQKKILKIDSEHKCGEVEHQISCFDASQMSAVAFFTSD